MEMFWIQCIIFITLATQRSTESKAIYNNFERNSIQNLRRPVKCSELAAPVLSDILGAAFNPRYMSVDSPSRNEGEIERKNINSKRGAQSSKSFYVDDTYAMELSDKPAWEVTHLSDDDKVNRPNPNLEQTPVNVTRVQRSHDRRRSDGSNQPQSQIKRPWECEAKIKWVDLGYDFYPRYLRTVECTRQSCFYGHFICKPRSFTVKILRRRRGECVPTKNSVGIDGLHGDLKELWIWEERAVNFCCDCSYR